MAFYRHRPGKTCVCLLFFLAIGCARARAQQAVSEPLVVFGRDWSEDVSATELSGTELVGDEKLAAAIQRIPNAAIHAAGAGGFTDVYSVRGLANTANFSKQALTLYVDDVPSASTYANFTEVGELERVTVLRGPQGDFFGKNSEAGIIEMRRITPDVAPSRFVAGALGSYDLGRTNFVVAGPLNAGTAFAKLEGIYQQRDGYLENIFLGTRPDFQEHLLAHGILRIVPTPDWEFIVSTEVHQARDGVQRFVPLFAPDPFRVAFDFDGRTDITGDVESLVIARQLTLGRLVFITSHRNWKLDPYEADLDYSPAPIVRGRIQLHQRQIAEEIRLESLESDAAWSGRLGVFADRVFNDGTEVFALPGLLKEINFEDDESEFAIFGRITRRFGQRVEFTGGMRLAYNAESITRTRHLSVAPPTAFGSDRAEWNVQPRIAVAYHCSPETTAYLSSTYGYKNGGFSYLETDPRLASFERERVWSNEAGLRARLFDRRVELHCAAFFNQVEDYQVERPAIPPDITVFNAPRVVAWGGEMEVKTQLVKDLQLRGALGYTRSEFRDYQDPFTATSYRGKRTPFSPDFTATLEVRYSFRGVFAEAEVAATGETFFDEANTAEMRETPHAQGNVRLGYENSRLNISIFCDNVGDARFFTQKITYAAVGTPAPPRTFGATFRLQL